VNFGRSVGDGEIGGWLVHLGGMRAAVAPGNKGQRQQQDECE
jgi:hypothetical protein